MVLDGGKEAIYLAGNKKGKTVQYSYHDSPSLLFEPFRCLESCPTFMLHYIAVTHLILMTTADIRLPI